MSLLEIKNLSVIDSRNELPIIKNLNFTLEANTCLGVVGESGSGKSMTAKAILGLTSPWLNVTGEILFDGMNLLELSNKSLRKIRGQKICMVLQDAMSSFNPLYTIGKQMIETVRENLGVRKNEAIKLSLEALEKMCIRNPEQVMKKYPHQLSGGMLQRCMIGIAIMMKPDIIIADEPTTALDSINQREVVEEFKRLRELTGTSIIFISHDLGVVQYLAESLLVMRNGECVEYGNANEIFINPQHTFTKYLIDTRVSLANHFNQSMTWRLSQC
ncbi:ABC transporter ATP-binding protein [Bacillus sp. 03113]|uniref:ABC transporter ATP-binding protein n=1 Tax=Bacillus sp. 03113 TaxID=2578211 RepID=UPI001143F7E5|nr:ABC transporter ATP-binding protein [Bacillus sp. 03113]